MIPEFVDRFESGKEGLRAVFSAAHPSNYSQIVEEVVRILNPDGSYYEPDPTRIDLVDHGDYQGTLLFVIPEFGYQPSGYWYVKMSYGSCSGCDTLMRIRGYSDEPPTEQQIDDYMTLALHIVQRIKKMED